MTYQNNFERKEMKYILSPAQYAAVRAAAEAHCEPDKFPSSTVTSIYYDTPDSLLIRRSLERPAYKEKLRVRVYGNPATADTAYVEVKKKYEGIVYKRRTGMAPADAAAWLRGEERRDGSRIEREIERFRDFYGNLKPAMLIACERDSFYSAADGGFRLTFDKSIRFRQNDLRFAGGAHGELLLPQGWVLMEAKAPGYLPRWFINTLSENKVYKTSFSKYGTAYNKRLRERYEGGRNYA